MLKNSLIYMFAEIVNKGIPFLLLPLLTKYLTPYDYGIITSFNAFIGFVTIFMTLSVHGAINVNFFKYNHTKLKLYIANAIFLLIAMLLIGIFFTSVFHTQLSDKLLLDSEWLYLGLVVAIAQTITLINLTLWLAQKRPKSYSIYQITQTFLTSILSFLMIVAYNLHWTGQLISIVVGSISFSLISLYLLYKRDYLTLKYDKDSLKDLLSFGVPLIPHKLSGWLSTSGDRLLLITLMGATSTGLFTVGYQIGMIMSVIVTAFHKAWNPFIYGRLSRGMSDSEKVEIVKYMYLYFFAIIILIIILNIFAFYLFKYWIDIKFIDSYRYVIYILIGYGLNGMYFMVVSYIFFFKKTKELASITFSISILHIVLSYIFIVYYGTMGVVYSSVISYLLVFLLVFWYSQKIYPLPLLFWRNR